jgi:radical SAM superfamily enzyme YgiQ (UPF0313 family)
LRKVEAALLKKYRPDDVVVAHPSWVDDFVDEDTEVIGVTTMDPLGLGPLATSYKALFQSSSPSYAQVEFERLIERINGAREASRSKARLLVGGPGVWELAARPKEMNRLKIDYVFEGEADDIACDLFNYVCDESRIGKSLQDVQGLCDGPENDSTANNRKFIFRWQLSQSSPSVEDIPDIVRPSMKSIVEVMRGCGIGCDFCEVTRRPLRYYPPEKVRRETEVNVRAGFNRVWLHSDEIFAYQHGRNFVPNAEALEELLSTVMGIRGIEHANPTHARISIPAAYPELVERLSRILKASPVNRIGVQIGIETGSERLAKMHMKNKTLPLRVGPDGSWNEIVLQGAAVLNRNYWIPAFTVQVGQAEETWQDNWDTTALINRMSNCKVDGRPLEFTVTPMQNVPLTEVGRMAPVLHTLNQSELAVYYVSYRHTVKMAAMEGVHVGRRTNPSRLGASGSLALGGMLMLRMISAICKRGGLDPEKLSRYGLDGYVPQITA